VRRLEPWLQLAAPALLVVATAVVGSFTSRATEIYFLTAILSVAIVVAIYVFVGNSGVLSFGQLSFVAVGAFASGVMTVPLESKQNVLPDLFPLLRDHTIGDIPALVLATVVGAAFALLVGVPLMRLSGLAAGIATFAVLEITHNLLREWTKIGPGATTLSLVPETTDLTADQVYLELTFVTLAMLVIGGITSLWGAVVGALAVSGLDSFLSEAEQGVGIGGVTVDLPQGARLVVLGALMAIVLVLRPSGLTGGREFGLPRLGRGEHVTRDATSEGGA